MQLTPPKKNVFWISSVITVFGLVLSAVDAASGIAIWVVFLGNLLLWLSVALKGF